MKPEHLGNNIYREYLGASFLQELRAEIARLEGQPESNLNEGNWRFVDPKFRFIKFDLEYIYYELILNDDSEIKTDLKTI